MSRRGAADGYARVLFDLATLADSVDATDEGLFAAVAAIRGNVDLRTALADTSLPAETKRDVLRDIFGENVTPEVLAVVTVLVERGMTDEIGAVASAYREIAEAERGVLVAQVTTVVPLTDELRSSVIDKLTASLGSPVVLRERVDEKILGGIVIEVGGRVLDGSVSSQLENVRRSLAGAQGGEA
jgi:F-type H+-transporting ATPase subunit delta